MRLRTRIQPPERFEDEDYNSSAASDATKPAFPSLLKEHTVAFNPHLPPAAFPSLTMVHSPENEGRVSEDHPGPADIIMQDIDPPPGQIFLPVLQHREHLGSQPAWKDSSGGMQDPPVLGTSFLDDVETSDEENCEVNLQSVATTGMLDSNQRDLVKTPQDPIDGTAGDPEPSISWNQLPPAIQVEIFENACSSCCERSGVDMLGLSHKELCDVTTHLWARNKQVVAEDHGIEELQRAQLCAILRKDHSSILGANSWRDHVACTRRHISRISVQPNYFICTNAEMELARKFLDERAIDTRVLGEWRFNKSKDAAVSKIRTQAFQGSQRREGFNSGYASRIPEQGNGRVATSIACAPPRDVLSKIPNSVHGSLSGLLPDHRENAHSILDTGLQTVTSQHHGADPSTAAVTPTPPTGLQLAGSPVALHARDSHQASLVQNAMAAAAGTRGGRFQAPDASYKDGHGTRQVTSPPPHEIHPPKPPRDSQYLHDRYVLTNTGQTAATLKISPRRLEMIPAVRSLEAKLSTVGLQEVLTPPTVVGPHNSTNDTPQQKTLRPQRPMPVARESLTFHDSSKLSAFSLKLLEIQRGAAGLSTLPDRQAVASPKRLKPNPPQDNIFNLTSDNLPAQAFHGSSQLQGEDSASVQDAPPWSPITQISNGSRPPSRRESYKNDFQLQKLSSANASEIEFQPSLTNGMLPVIHSTPQTPPRTKAYVRPKIAGNGSPVLGLSNDARKSSIILPGGDTHQGGKPKIRQIQVRAPSQSAQPLHTAEQVTPNLETPCGQIFGAPAFTDPLRIYATGLLQDYSDGPRPSPSKRLRETLARAVVKNPLSAKGLGITPTSISPTEQVKVDAIFSQSPTMPHDIGETAYTRLPEQISKTKITSSKKRRDEDDSPTRGQGSLVMKASEALVLAAAALRESPQTKPGKDGKVRSRTYVKSQKQIEKEAANAAAKAAFGKGAVAGKKRANGGQKTDAKASAAPQLGTQQHQSPRFLDPVEAPPVYGDHASRNGPSGEMTIGADSKTSGLAEKLHSLEKKRTGSPKQCASAEGIGVRGAPVEDESDAAGTPDASSVGIRKIEALQGKAAAASRAKAAVQSYQMEMAVQGKSALADMASNEKAVNRHEQPAFGREEAADHVDRGRTREGTIVCGQAASSCSGTAGLKAKVPSGSGGQSTPGTGKKRSSALGGELSVPKAQGEGRTKAFRGNQYYFADGTPRPRKERAPPAQ